MSPTRTSRPRDRQRGGSRSIETNVDEIDGGLDIGPDRTGRMLQATVNDIETAKSHPGDEATQACGRYLPKEARP